MTKIRTSHCQEDVAKPKAAVDEWRGRWAHATTPEKGLRRAQRLGRRLLLGHGWMINSVRNFYGRTVRFTRVDSYSCVWISTSDLVSALEHDRWLLAYSMAETEQVLAEVKAAERQAGPPPIARPA